MNKKLFWIVMLSLLSAGTFSEAQQPKKVHRIGYLSITDPATESTRIEAIRLALRDFGFIEGQNIAVEFRYGEGKRDRYPELAAELVSLKVEKSLLNLCVSRFSTIRPISPVYTR